MTPKDTTKPPEPSTLLAPEAPPEVLTVAFELVLPLVLEPVLVAVEVAFASVVELVSVSISKNVPPIGGPSPARLWKAAILLTTPVSRIPLLNVGRK